MFPHECPQSHTHVYIFSNRFSKCHCCFGSKTASDRDHANERARAGLIHPSIRVPRSIDGRTSFSQSQSTMATKPNRTHTDTLVFGALCSSVPVRRRQRRRRGVDINTTCNRFERCMSASFCLAVFCATVCTRVSSACSAVYANSSDQSNWLAMWLVVRMEVHVNWIRSLPF